MASSYIPFAANGDSSRNGVPGSMSRNTRSRGNNLPRAVWRSRARAGPPSAASARRRFKSSTSARICAALVRNSRLFASTGESRIAIGGPPIPGNLPRHGDERKYEVESRALAHGQRRECVDIRHHVNHGGSIGSQRLSECRRESARVLDPDAERAHVLGNTGEVHLVEGPQSAAALGLGAAIDAVEAALALVAAAIVVNDRDGVDVPAYRGLDLADVIPESGIACECYHRPLRARAFGAEPSREGPAQVAGAAHIALARARQIVHAAHPHASMTGVDHHDRIIGHMLRELAAQPLRTDWHRVGGEQR